MKEPSIQLNQLNQAMKSAIENDRTATEPAFATFLYEDLAPGLAQRLSKERSNDESYLKIVGESIELLVRFFVHELKQKRYNYAFYSAMTLLFNYEGSIHKIHYQIPSEELQKLRTSQQEWRQTIKVGDQLDILVTADERSRVTGWMQAKITNIIDDTLFIEFPLSPLMYDGKINRWSTEVMPFESKTKEDYRWRKEQLANAKEYEFEAEMHDKSSWNKGTILKLRTDQVAPDRFVVVAYCGLRVYRDIPNCQRKDAHGTFDGWSEKFDEWIPVFSPRIQQWGSRIGVVEEQDFEDGQDDQIQSDEEFNRLYAVPRLGACTSALYLRYINIFGNQGGFDLIIDLLENAKDENGINITIMGCLAQIITLPYPVYHKSFIQEKGLVISNAIKKRLLSTTDQALRDVRKEQVDAIIKSVQSISKRFLNKDERDVEAEVLRLELCNKSLISNYLERRIQGIRDLSTLVKNNVLSTSSKTFTPAFLFDWMVKNDVFNTVWDDRKTHLQIVQRTNEIFKFLLRSDKMDEQLLKLFWALGKADHNYQIEVFKIITEASSYLQQPHIEFFFNELTLQPAEKLTLAEFDCLCDLGKHCKISDFQIKIRNFFWRVIINSENYKEDLVENCITKFTEIIKEWSFDEKKQIFAQLVNLIQGKETGIIPTLRIITKMIKNLKGEKISIATAATYPTSSVPTCALPPTASYSHVTADGKIIQSYSYAPQDATSEEVKAPKEVDNALVKQLNLLQNEFGLMDKILDNLLQYCKSVRNANIESTTDSKKVFVSSKTYSHSEEISERLNFMKYYASVSDYQFRKTELRIMYESLSVQSPIKQDQNEFLIWCKQACENQGSLDLNEIGEYFTELLQNNQLKVETLPMAGFDFLASYFLSVNESQSKLIKTVTKKTIKLVKSSSWQNWNDNQDSHVEETDFKILINPKQLEKLDLIWMLVLKVQDDAVAQKAIQFLIKVYMQIDDSLNQQRSEIVQLFISECIKLLQNQDLQTHEVQKIVSVLHSIIQQSELKGAGEIIPHSSILKGECLERITIKNNVKSNSPNLIVKVLTSASAFEFVDRVSRWIGLAPQFVEVKLKSGALISAADYGKTLGELGFKNYDIVTFSKDFVFDRNVTPGDLIDPQTNKLSAKAFDIFNEWYDLYSNENGVMTPESTIRFIAGATNEIVSTEDSRIKILFSNFDSNKDGILERSEFITFYETACRGKLDTVYDNLSNHFIRKDLLRMSEVYEEQQFTREQMPRFTLSANQDQFDTLFRLLERKDQTSQQVWELIHMLATNQQIYNRVLSLEVEENGWQKFFESGSIQMQIYTDEIIQALMEDNEDTSQRVWFVERQDSSLGKAYASVQKNKQQDVELKQTWSTKFIKNGGLKYILNTFTKSDLEGDGFQLQKLEFMVTIMKVYITAALQSVDNPVVRASLMMPENKNILEESKQMIKLADDLDILNHIDFNILQSKLYDLIKSIVNQNSPSIEQKNIIQNALHLWMHCQINNHVQFKQEFLRNEESELFVMSGLLYSSEEKIRKEFQETFLRLAKSIAVQNEQQSVHGFLLKLLSKKFHEISKYSCRQFFDLFNELIDMHFIKESNKCEEKNLFSAEDLLSQIIDKIRADKRSVIEKDLDEITTQQLAIEKESLLIGLVQLTNKIISTVDKSLSEKIVADNDLINEIFKEFLFASVFTDDDKKPNAENMLELIKTKAPRKVKLSSSATGKQANKSREAAYQLLNELIRKSPVIMTNFIKDQLKPLLSMVKKPKTWNYTPPSTSDRIQKYVGLRNLGCICYMNSMMQQFFMIPAFRYNLLCVDDGLPADIKEFKGEQLDEVMLHQLQRLFAHLELSERPDYNPLGFVFSFKESDGQPTNISEQKDAQEFLTVLFDRLERALIPTSRKYLLQSVFGGKNCSQLICPECGKVKNKMEDFCNISLTVKDINSVYDSLKTMIDGEVINDYKCDGCNKKVDITKRTLISETPNVLIIHLQRLLFDFDTFRNEKMNQHFEFPTNLDLTPYTYHERMKVEGRVKKQDNETEEGIDNDEIKEEKPEDPDNIVPLLDDCFEYKLVGVNVHSGSANAGHYWSYINTVRGMEEKDNKDPSWGATESDQWMEFNDSTVKDYKFENLKDECFGDKPSEQKQSTMSAWGYGGGNSSYGKSAYMLIYERRVKKPIKIVVSEPGDGVYFDEKTKEHIKLINYKEGVDNETPNSIFGQVLEDNTKFTFENDVYSQEFFNFLKQILQNVASFGSSDNSEMRQLGIDIAHKASFEIIARCFYNSGIKDIVAVMIQIFQQDQHLVLNYCNSTVLNPELFLEILLECTDNTARVAIGDLYRFLICQLKVIEKDTLLTSNDTVSFKFLEMITSHLPNRVAKNWNRFDKYLELLAAFALYSPDEALLLQKEIKLDNWTADTAQLGIEFFFKNNMLERLLDFILQDKSPLFDGSSRITMGSSYTSANFTSLLKVITVMSAQKNLIEKYPQSEVCQKMMLNRDILSKIIEDHQQSKNFAERLSLMCKDNLQISKKIAKILYKQINQTSAEKVIESLKTVKKFFLIQDSLQQKRLEWLLGISQIVTKNPYRSNKIQYGVELVDKINDDANKYPSTLISQVGDDALLNLLLKYIGRQDQFCIKVVKDIMSICLKDEKIARYIYRLAPHTYQHSRFTDWFAGYIKSQKEEVDKMSSNSWMQKRIATTDKAVETYKKFDILQQKLDQEGVVNLWAQIQTPQLDEIRKSWLNDNDDVIKHYPPQYIVGQQVGEEREPLLKFEDQYVIVTLTEINCEYMYSNPTLIFNLSLSDKLVRTKNFQFMSYQQYKNYENPNAESLEQNVHETRDWQTYHKEGPVVLQLAAKSKVNGLLKVEVQVLAEPVVDIEIVNMQSMVGEGIKQTQAFDTPLSPDQFQQWRQNFWEERSDHEVWQLLKQVCGVDNETAAAMLEASELTLPNGSIQTILDQENGVYYKLPISVINDPSNYSVENHNNDQVNVQLPESTLKDSLFSGDSRILANFLKTEPHKKWNCNFSIIVRTSGNISLQQNEPQVNTTAPLRRKQVVADQVAAAAKSTSISIATSGNYETKTFECGNCRHTAFDGMEYCEKCGESLKAEGFYDDYFQ